MHEARDAVDVPVHGCVVMPGFVDSGLHLPLFESAKRSARPRRKRLDDFFNEGISLMRSCLQHGTLTAGIRAYTEMGTGGTDLIALRQLAKIGDNPVNMVRSWSYNRGVNAGRARQLPTYWL
jgi:predicted amidohydrolase YtcJ